MPATFSINSLPVADLQSPNDASGRLAKMYMQPGSGWASPRMMVSWTYSAPEGGQPQAQYELEIATSTTPTASGGSPSSTIVSGAVSSAATSVTPTPSSAYVEGNYYFVRLRVNDGLEWSAWDGWFECRVRWALTTHALDVRIAGSPPTSWTTSALNTTEPTNTDIVLEYNSSTAGGGSPPDPWKADLSQVTKRNFVHYRAWFFGWGTSPASRPQLLDITIQCSGLLLQPDQWLPNPISGEGGSIEIGKFAFGGQSLKMVGDGTEQVIREQVRVEPNTNYMLQGRVESIGNSGGRIQLADTDTGASIFSTTAKTTDSSFTEGPNVAGPWNSGNRTAVWIQTRINGSSSTACFFDGIGLTKGTVAPPWTPTTLASVPGQIGLAASMDAGGFQVDAKYGGIIRFRTTNGRVIDLGVDGLERDGIPMDVPPGSISAYGGSSAPEGYLLCDGTSYLRTDYAALFAIIGTTFGSVDGTHFNVPDLRQRFPLGKAASGTGSTLGGTGGGIDHTHTGPSHTHPHATTHTHQETVRTSGTATFIAGGGSTGSALAANVMNATLTAGGSGSANLTSADAPGSTDAGGTGATGTGNPPFLAVNYIIKT